MKLSSVLLFIQLISLNILVIACKVTHQNSHPYSCYGSVYSDTTSIRMDLGNELEVYDFKSGEVIASVGASDGWFEFAISALYDNLTFYLQDIDEECLNDEHLTELRTWYESMSSKTTNTKFVKILGRKDSLGLPNQGFDKVLMRVTFHHLFIRNPLMQSIKTSLKPKGLLMIAENIVPETGILDPYCKNPLWHPEDLIKEVESYGFKLVKQRDLSPDIDYRIKKKKEFDFNVFIFQLE